MVCGHAYLAVCRSLQDPAAASSGQHPLMCGCALCRIQQEHFCEYKKKMPVQCLVSVWAGSVQCLVWACPVSCQCLGGVSSVSSLGLFSVLSVSGRGQFSV